MNQSVCMLPESAIIEAGITKLVIENHRIVSHNTLFNWLRYVVRLDNHKKAFLEMEQQGIDWYAVAEYMATEMEDDEQFTWGIYWMTNNAKDFERLAKTEVASKVKKDIIHAIRNCDSYESFAKKFAHNGRFVKALRNKMIQEVESW